MAASPKTMLVLLCSAVITRLPGQLLISAPGSRMKRSGPTVASAGNAAQQQRAELRIMRGVVGGQPGGQRPDDGVTQRVGQLRPQPDQQLIAAGGRAVPRRR